MEYKIIISETCLEEIEENCEYIEKILKAEQASNRLRKSVRNVLAGLKDSPKIYPKIEKRDRTGRSYRKIIIKKYILVYTIIEEEKVVLISHMYYSGRNYLDGGLL